jgi:transketolase
LRTAFIDALESAAERNPRLVLVVGDLGYGVVDSFRSRFPNQFLNAGISEQNMAGMAAGLASEGRVVFIYSIANFPTFRCLEQIRNDIAYTGLPVVVVAVGAGFSYGTLGSSHHAIEDMAVMRALPGMRVLSPADSYEVEACMDLILKDPAPTYLRIGKNGEGEVHGGPVKNLSRGLPVFRGSKVIVLTTGSILSDVLKALRLTDPAGEFFELRSIPLVKPLGLDADLSTFQLVVTVEEHSKNGGLGTAVLERVSESEIQIPVIRIGISENPARPQGSHEYLKDLEGLSLANLVGRFRAIRDTLEM